MTTQPAPRWRVRLDVLAALIAIVAGSLVIYRQLGPHKVRNGQFEGVRPEPTIRPEPPAPKEAIALTGLSMRGALTARVALVTFADFECPACGHFARNALRQIERQYVDTGKVRVGFSHLPLPQHKRAKAAARSAECAGRDGRFWEMHDLLFTNQRDLSDDVLKGLASELRVLRFDECFGDKNVDQLVLNQTSSARLLDVSRTPTIFLGTVIDGSRLQVAHRWSGSRGFDGIAEMIDTLLDKATGG